MNSQIIENYKYDWELIKETYNKILFGCSYPPIHQHFQIPLEDLDSIIELSKSQDEEVYNLYTHLCKLYPKIMNNEYKF